MEGHYMIFEKKQKDIQFYSDDKISLKRKTMIGLLALAIIGGGISGYTQHQGTSKSDAHKINNTKTISPAVMGRERD